jgi:cyclopropane-fatty-acyl-phospholipid synthase
MGRARRLERLLASLLERIEAGSLRLELPDGRVLGAHAHLAGPEGVLVLHRWRALRRLALGGEMGMVQAFRDGDWSSPDLTALLELAARNEPAWQRALAVPAPLRWMLRAFHRLRDNSLAGSRRNIAFHYDLGNAFYRHWLDPDMIYSSALYRTPQESLEQAQAAKIGRITELLELERTPAPQVLEIGCGWGALALDMAGRGARVTGITLSREQLAHAQERVKAMPAGAVAPELRLQDYRHVQGQFDRIVSIEMIEAVGERHWPEYFRVLRERLKPGGVAVIQAITIDDAQFASYRAHPDFIQRFIFPGGMLPSLQILQREAAAAGLELQVEERFGASYALTLAEWRRRFDQAWPQIAQLGFDAHFRRLWQYYLAYCEAGFRTGRVDVGLFRLARLGNDV